MLWAHKAQTNKQTNKQNLDTNAWYDTLITTPSGGVGWIGFSSYSKGSFILVSSALLFMVVIFSLRLFVNLRANTD